ncbi:unnamed protein product [Mytilus coruscus]|uniref:LRRNT domain-containing protein n=1 Tax=Mytilus coruscus TaxID=42192 RepID=A0A6J8BY43_MYTCO|nr:unnamed protein product [Mytilus coruscus]
MLFTVGVMLMFSLPTIHLAHAQGCPNMCDCFGTSVVCSDISLTQIPNNIPSTTTYLDLSENSITSIEQNVFTELTSLETLVLYSNDITSIEQNAFVGLTSLESLIIYDNSITSIEENALTELTSLEKLGINDNPLVCCSVTGFVNWVNGRSWVLFYGTCTDHNKTTEIIDFDITGCIVPVNGGWSDWENSTCSVTCGEGTVTINRTCNNPVPSGGGNNCSGDSIDTASCNQGVCPKSCSTPGKESDNKSGKGSDNKSGKGSDNKSGQGSDNKSGKGSYNKSGNGLDNKSG